MSIDKMIMRKPKKRLYNRKEKSKYRLIVKEKYFLRKSKKRLAINRKIDYTIYIARDTTQVSTCWWFGFDLAAGAGKQDSIPGNENNDQ